VTLRLLLAFALLAPARARAQEDASASFHGLAVEESRRSAAASADDALPPPSEADRDAAIRTIVSRLVARGVSAPAAARARRTIREMLAPGDGRAARNLARQNVWLFIVPQDQRLTDLPEFASLRGRTTHDGRPWEEVRGVGHMDIPGGRIGVAFPEEDLLNTAVDPAKGYPGLFVLVHELSHCIQDLGLPSDLYARTLQVYDAAMARPERTGLGLYADSNAHENFAQAASAYLGVGHLDSPRQHADGARARLMTAQPQTAALLAEIFGPARNVWELAPRAVAVADTMTAAPLP
jgi:hypothetical protein